MANVEKMTQKSIDAALARVERAECGVDDANLLRAYIAMLRAELERLACENDRWITENERLLWSE